MVYEPSMDPMMIGLGLGLGIGLRSMVFALGPLKELARTLLAHGVSRKTQTCI